MSDECKCSLRTKLVGDGCAICNPELLSELAPATGSGESYANRFELDNETKIRFCNAYDDIRIHANICSECAEYLVNGDGDLCWRGKDIIAMHLAYTDTKLRFPQNDQAQPRRR